MQGLLDMSMDDVRGRETKFNIFHFQDHLLYWIHESATAFCEGDYPISFERLSIVYQDVTGILSKDEIGIVKTKFDALMIAKEAYQRYCADYSVQPKGSIYAPPRDLYLGLIDFRRHLMTLMAKHNMLMIIINKSQYGAGSEM